MLAIVIPVRNERESIETPRPGLLCATGAFTDGPSQATLGSRWTAVPALDGPTWSHAR